MALQTTLYNIFFKRTSTFMASIMIGTFFFERSLTVASDAIFEAANKGKLWKDIKHNYEK
ncbi:ubiquinol-cytochrome C reductase complex subunit oxen [Cotesia typhae]|uniref:ubiquinol-cytochrome C reductase complex subunit oxen n=1 Tax=Cotesia typhae TaxID=2053667 RepID=UPI003D69CBF9